MEKAAHLAAAEDISVRELERMAKRSNKSAEQEAEKSKPERKMSYYSEVELALREHLGRK